MVKKHHLAKNAFAEKLKPEQMMRDLQKTDEVCAASAKWIAMARAGSGGRMYVLDLNKTDRIANTTPLLCTHAKKVDGAEWCPFNDDLLASASQDCEVHLNLIPDNWLAEDSPMENLTQPTQALKGHQKRVSFVRWNPTVSDTLASVSWDHCVKLWNAETAECVREFNIPSGKNPTALCWNNAGNLLAVADKNPNCSVYVYDPRQSETEVAYTIEGLGSTDIFFADKFNFLGISTTSRSPKKNWIQLYDLGEGFNASKPTLKYKYDTSNGTKAEKCYFDQDLDLLWTFQKGKLSTTCLHLTQSSKPMPLFVDRLQPQNCGACFIPKRACDTGICEIARFMKICAAKQGSAHELHPLKFTVPRKGDGYHADIYPPTKAARPSKTVYEWLEGQDGEVVFGSMNRDDQDWVGNLGEQVAFEKKATYDELAAENAQLKERIAELEAQLGQ